MSRCRCAGNSIGHAEDIRKFLGAGAQHRLDQVQRRLVSYVSCMDSPCIYFELPFYRLKKNDTQVSVC